MPYVVAVADKHPQLPRFLAPNACLVGDIRFGSECSVWFGAVLRGDINYVELGDRCNVQDNCVLHVSRDFPCILGDDITMGHQATAHGCIIGNGCLIGMGARVLDGVILEEGVLVAAGCVVPEGMHVPAHQLVAGVPGRIIKTLTTEMQDHLKQSSLNYVRYQDDYPEFVNAALD